MRTGQVQLIVVGEEEDEPLQVLQVAERRRNVPCPCPCAQAARNLRVWKLLQTLALASLVAAGIDRQLQSGERQWAVGRVFDWNMARSISMHS